MVRHFPARGGQMIKVNISHVYGNQETSDLQIVKLSLDRNTPEDEALNNGWLLYGGEWYASRSSRIRVADSPGDPHKVKGYRFEYSDSFNMTPEIRQVYEIYTRIRGFKQKYSIDGDADRSSSLLVYNGDALVAFTKFIRYKNALESQITAWDYSDPKASIGRKIVGYEVARARQLGVSHLYIGPCYGHGAKYKANFKGFEWFTGSEWSTDRARLFELLERDSAVKSIADLNQAFRSAI